MTNNYRKFLAFSLALGGVLLGEQIQVNAQEVEEPVVAQSENVTEDEETAVKEEVTTKGDEETTTDTTKTEEAAEEPTPAAEPKVVEVSSVGLPTTEEVNTYTTVNTTVTTNNEENIQIICSALNIANQQNVIEAIKENYNSKDTTPIKLTNEYFVDSDKWSLAYTPFYDTQHCWANAAANVLWTTGWAQGLISPITGQPFTSVDEVAVYFSTYFTDYPGDTDAAYEWFFDGNYLVENSTDNTGKVIAYAAQLIDTSKTKYNNGNYDYWYDDWKNNAEGKTTTLPYLTQYCVDVIKQAYNLKKSNLSAIKQLDNLGTLFGAELGVSLYNGGGHALTVVGVIKDANADPDSLDAYKAVIVADSDNDPVTLYGESLPDTQTLAYQIKAEQTNSYTIYYLDTYTDANGNTWWNLLNYFKGHTLITDIETLNVENDVNKAKALDPINNVTTNNVYSTPDLVLLSQDMVNDTNTQYKSNFNIGEKITLNYIYENPSQSNFKTNENDYVYEQIIIYKDGNFDTPFAAFKYKEVINLAAQTKCSPEGLIDLNEFVDFAPGEYDVKIILNVADSNGDKYKEAYSKNNELSGYAHFTINPLSKDDFGNDGLDNQDTAEENEAKETTVNLKGEPDTKETVDTGVETTIMSYIASIAVTSLGAVSLSLRKRKNLKRSLKNKDLY